MAFGNGPSIVTSGLTILFDVNSPGGVTGTTTLNNMVPSGPISSVALYPTSTYGYITSGSVYISGSNNNYFLCVILLTKLVTNAYFFIMSPLHIFPNFFICLIIILWYIQNIYSL